MNLPDNGHKADGTAFINKISAILYYHTFRVKSRRFLKYLCQNREIRASDKDRVMLQKFFLVVPSFDGCRGGVQSITIFLFPAVFYKFPFFSVRSRPQLFLQLPMV